MYMVIKCLLEVKESFLEVMTEMGWDCNITLRKWKTLSSMLLMSILWKKYCLIRRFIPKANLLPVCVECFIHNNYF